MSFDSLDGTQHQFQQKHSFLSSNFQISPLSFFTPNLSVFDAQFSTLFEQQTSQLELEQQPFPQQQQQHQQQSQSPSPSQIWGPASNSLANLFLSHDIDSLFSPVDFLTPHVELKEEIKVKSKTSLQKHPPTKRSASTRNRKSRATKKRSVSTDEPSPVVPAFVVDTMLPSSVPVSSIFPSSKKYMSLNHIAGISEKSITELHAANITNVAKLLEFGRSTRGRTELESKLGLSSGEVLSMIHKCDLMRINGVGTEYSDLLEASGVHTLPELARRNADLLHQRLVETNVLLHKAKSLPSIDTCKSWIVEAQQLPKVIEYHH